MAATPANRMPWWAWAWPALACALLVAAAFIEVTGALAGATALLLAATVFAAVYHAEVVAHRVGEPFGTLMLGGGPETAGLARDTVFAAVMIICNGLVGVCLLWRGAPFRAGVQARGRERRPRGPDRARHPYPRAAELHDDDAGAELHDRAARLRWRDVGRALRLLRLRADGAPPRLFPAARNRRRGDACAAAVARRHLDQRRRAADRARRRRRAREGADPDGRGRRRRGRRAEGGDRHRHCRGGAPARGACGAAGGAGEPPADEPQPRARLGAGEHRPDDPGGRGGVGPPRKAARPRARAEGGGAAGADRRRRRDHARHRPHDGAAGDRPPRDLRRLPVPRGGALAGEEGFAPASPVRPGSARPSTALPGQRAGPSSAPRRRGSVDARASPGMTRRAYSAAGRSAPAPNGIRAIR